MGSKVPYLGPDFDGEAREVSEAGRSLWVEKWAHDQTLDPFDPAVVFDGEEGVGVLPPRLAEYGEVLAHGLDTLEEAYSVELSEGVLATLEEAKQSAAELSEGGKDCPVLVKVGDEEWQVSPRGAKGGVRYWLSSDWARVTIRTGQSWAVSIRYSSEALWQYDPRELLARARLWLRSVAKDGKLPDADLAEWNRLSQVHWCVDTHSPTFSAEMTPDLWRAVVAPSSVKAFPIGRVDHLSDDELRAAICEAMDKDPKAFFEGLRAGLEPEQLSAFASGGMMQTLTIGFRKPLEIQVYDKGREIREASGKEWMLDLWERSSTWRRPEDGSRPKDVWRGEVRMRGDYLRDRGVVTFDDWLERGQRLIVEALSSRRLTRPTADSNRSRWPAHELWQIIAVVSGFVDQLVPLGRRFLDTAKQRAEAVLQQAVGCIRAAVVLLTGDYHDGAFTDILYGAPERTHSILGILDRDGDGLSKARELIERYRYIPREDYTAREDVFYFSGHMKTGSLECLV